MIRLSWYSRAMQSMVSKVEDILDNLSKVTVLLNDGSRINLTNELKSIPRSGKAVRIDKHTLALPKQSLFDHVIQLAFNADIFLAHFGFEGIDTNLLAALIAFHDIAEPITGDIPAFTSEWKQFKKFRGSKEKHEALAHELILRQLPEPLKRQMSDSLSASQANLESKATFDFFQFLDKTEPIISVWRYIALHREQLNMKDFIVAMDDFFLHAAVRTYAFNSELTQLVDFLQDKDNAYHYGLNQLSLSNTKFSYMKDIIESREMICVAA